MKNILTIFENISEQVQDGRGQPEGSGEAGAGGESQREESLAGPEDGGGEQPVQVTK